MCCYCQQSHPSTDCSVVTDIAARKQILRTSGRCFNCLRKNHIGRNCRSTAKCLKCKRRHHTSICEGGSPRPHPSPVSVPTGLPSMKLDPEAPAYHPAQTTNNLCSDNMKTVLLQTARSIIHNPYDPRITLEVRILFDSGSQRSYISERARNLLALNSCGEQTLSIATFGSDREQPKVCPVVNVGMCLRSYPSMILSLYVVPVICEPLAGQSIAACVEHYPHLLGLNLADCPIEESCLRVDILIGSDYYWDLVTGDTRRSAGGPTAVHTKLGWVLSGPTPVIKAARCSTNLTTTHVLRVDICQDESTRLDRQLRAFWELESLGVQQEEKTLYEDFTANVRFEDERYKVSLPWKEFHKTLPDNYQMSLHRLHGLLRRLRQEPSILREYDNIINDQLQKGIIETVPTEGSSSNLTHYLPHHAVVRHDKTTTKLRVVYDASARSGNGPSLNDCLHKGPSFNQLILDLLLRFRSYKIPLTADIEKAFLMVGMEERDRDVLRFLWVDDTHKEQPELRVFRFTRVVFGVCSSPFLLNATIRFHLERYLQVNERLVRRLLLSTYVDEIITGGDSEEEVFDLYCQAKEMLRCGGFNLRKFCTSSSSLQKRIDHTEAHNSVPPETLHHLEETYAEATLGMPQTLEAEEHKVLGVLWNPSSDHFIFDVTELASIASTLEPTKRNLVSVIGRFYDPLGFLAPIVIQFKVLFRKLCQNKVEWDSTLPEELIVEWKTLISDLSEGHPISLPRVFPPAAEEPPISAYLCGFSDASTKAYGAVVYLVVETESHTVVRFVVAKTRVAPLQTQTVPRLELLAALLLSRLMVSVTDSLNSTMPYLGMKCYSDSQVTLYWIKGTGKEWRPFVQNRVKEIRHKVHPDCWSHCPGKANPADLLSRGMTVLELSVSRLWRAGPDWLATGGTSCPELELTLMPDECSAELKATSKMSHTLLATELKPTIGTLLDYGRFSSLLKLLRVTVRVLRAVKIFRSLKTGGHNPPATITPEELSEVERLWIIHVQSNLAKEKDFESLQRQFGLFVDDKGVWRCGGRLTNAELSYSTMHPVLLPRAHPFTTLIVRDAHARVKHNGVKETLTDVRRRFWVVKGRSLVRAIIHRCIPCRRFEGASFATPPPPPLPVF